jgi:hypothetical protein
LKARHGRVWDAVELARDFEVLGFAAPLVVVLMRITAMEASDRQWAGA